MSKFKRFLSSFLVLTMVLGMFSMLGGIFTVDAAAEDFAPYTTHIKTYAELQKDYSDGFVYYGVEFFEEDGTPTDHVVKPGEVLKVRFYFKTTYYIGNGRFDLVFDRNIFDITNGEASGYLDGSKHGPAATQDGGVLSSNDSTFVEGTPYPTNGYVAAFTQDTISNINPDYKATVNVDPKFSLTRNYATAGSKYLAYSSKSGYSSKIYTDASDILFARHIDFFAFNIFRDTSNKNNLLNSDVYILETNVTVRSDAADGTITTVCLPELAHKLSTSGTKGTSYIQLSDTEDAASFTSYEKASYFSKEKMVEDTEHTFYISADGTYGDGGETPTTSHTATFMNGTETWDTQTVAENGSITAPTKGDPSKGDNYSFKGWSTDGTAANIVTFPQTMGTADVTYYAVFEEKAVAKHTATFKVDGVTYGTPAEYEEGAAIVAPADPAKTGYTFTGWNPTVGTMGTSDMVFNAVFEAKTYNVTFDIDGKKTNSTVKYDGTYTLPANPTKTGYTFDSWVDSEGNTVTTSSTHKIDGDVTITAKWNVNKYAVKFYNTDNSTTVYNESVAYGTDLDAIAKTLSVSDKGGYTFIGWATTANATTALSSLGTVSGAVSYYPVWVAGSATLEYYDGESLIGTPYVGKVDENVSLADPAAKTGYKFIGWFSDADLTNRIYSVTLTAGTTKVYAKYEAEQYTFEFYNGEDYVDSATYAYGTTPDYPAAPPVAHKTFLGWYDAAGVKAPETIPELDIEATYTYYAKYEDVLYTATFLDAEGKTYGEPVKGAVNSTVTAPATAPNKTGHTFEGWAKQGTSTVLTFPQKMPANGVTYVPVYSINTYTIEYYVDNQLEHTDSYKYGETVTPWTYTPETGETFTSWDTSKIPATMPAENLKFYGTKGTATYYVTFKINGEQYGDPVPYAYGATVVAPAYTAPEGYTFSGWDVGFSMGAENVTLNATLNKNSYKLRYYFFEDDETPYKEYDVLYGDSLTVPDDPTIPGYTFTGWDKTVASMTMPAENVNVYALATPIPYTVIFQDADGSTKTELTKYYNDTIVASDLPTVSKEGADFSYWTVNGVQANFPYTVTGSVTFVPKFADNTYTITYYVDGDVYGTPESYTFGDAITLKAALTKTGYTFSGWKDAAGSDISLPATMPANDIKIYGTWTVNQYDAIFDAGEGTFSDGKNTKTVKVNYGELPVVEDPQRGGYAFTGWSPALSVMTEAGASYTATYSAGAVNYTVQTYTMGLDGKYGTPATETKSGVADTTATVTAIAPEGFSVDNDMSVLSGTVSADGTLVLKVYYSRNKYTLSIDGAETEYYYGASIPAVSAPTKDGYKFTGWSAEIPTTMPAKSVTITSNWNVLQFTITFDTDGGSKVPAITQNYGTAIIKPSNPTREGYEFVKWDKEIPDTMPAESMTITAEWKVLQYTITFDTVGGTPIDAITLDYGAAVTAPDAPTKTGYAFKGWNKTIPATMPAYSMTITAKWDINSYDAVFVVDGKSTTVSTVFGTAPVPVSATKLGHSFTAWKAADGTEYASGVELPAIGVDGATYTAVFKANTYNAVFDANSGKFDDNSTVVNVPTVFGEAIVAPAAPTRTGFNFNGWTPTVGNMDAEGITFTAQWQQDTSFCSVQSVTRVTPNVYGQQLADYEIKVKGSPVKLEVTFADEAYNSSWLYDRNDPIVGSDDDIEANGVSKITAYNAAGTEVALGSADTAYEIWNIKAIYVEGKYNIRAKLTFKNDSWESVAFEYINTYDVEPTNPADLTSAAISATTVKRGDYVTLTVVTSTDVDMIRLARAEADGTTTTITYSNDVIYDCCQVSDADSVRTWTIKVRFSYAESIDSKTETWKLQYHKTNDKWYDSEYTYEIKMTRYAEVVSPVEGYDPYSVISVSAPETATKGQYYEITVVTTNDVSRVRLTVGTKASTYMKTSSNTTVTDNGDGSLTWVIRYKFTKAGELPISAQTRGNTWSMAVEADKTCTVA